MKRVALLFAALALGTGSIAFAKPQDAKPVYEAIAAHKAEAVQRLQDWIKVPSIAAEGRGTNEGCELMMKLAREAGFQKVERVDTDGKPGVFATLDAGAPRTVGLYFMYDVKQFDPAEWSSPPLDAAILDKPGFGKVVMGRGAVNQKGPEAAVLAALHAFQDAKRKPPVNLVLVAEGEEEIGSPHFHQIVEKPAVNAALRNCIGVFMPSAEQDPDGSLTVSLGAKGVVELELVATGEKWGRGPGKDVHSSLRAILDSPSFHLVQALNTLVTPDGDPAIDVLPLQPSHRPPRRRRSSTPRPWSSPRTRTGKCSRCKPGPGISLGAQSGTACFHSHGQHRRARGRVHGSWWQDGAAASRRRQARSADGART
jgi:acetylornithine deacetylase/succinyl-diaminopimelate desuccinylase-like protein